MKLEKWFYTPIWFEYLDLDTSSIAKKCLELRAQDFSNRVKSNAGGWQSVDIELNNFQEFSIISEILDSKIEEFGKSLNPEYKFRLDNLWININEKGNFNIRHVHPISSFSGTIYIQVDDDTGKICFYDEYMTRKHYPVKFSNDSVFHENVSYTPRNGMIIIFPAWTPHEVLPSESDMSRISMSFNIRQVY